MTQSSGRWRRRLLRYYLPLALASGLALVLVVLVGVILVTGVGGEHGPRRHMPSGGASGQTPPVAYGVQQP